jgi:rod shape-determining protein MreC
MKKINLFYLFLVVAFVLIIFLVINNKTVNKKVYSAFIYPMKGLDSIGRNFSDKMSYFSKMSKVREKNEELANKIALLEVDKSRINELENENSVLKKEIGFAEENKEFVLIPARVIGREPNSFLDHIIVDRGERDGVKKGLAVISEGVFIGQISEVYEKSSNVILVTSKDSLILAMLQKSRSGGLLHGGVSGLTLENVVQDVSYEPGEYVVTSGLDGELKPGLLIGKATGLESTSSDLFKSIAVEPIQDLSKLEFIFILK